MKICLLGSQNDENGILSPEGEARIQVVYAIWREFEYPDILLTGAFGKHFNTTAEPHWKYAKARLRELGVSESHTGVCVDSTNSREDIEFIKAAGYIKQFDTTNFVTSNYHVPRTSLWGGRVLDSRSLFYAASVGGNTSNSVHPSELAKINTPLISSVSSY